MTTTTNRRERGQLAIELFDRFSRPVLVPLALWVKAVFALPMTEAERAIFTGMHRARLPADQIASEVWNTIGRRGRQDPDLAFMAAFFGLSQI